MGLAVRIGRPHRHTASLATLNPGPPTVPRGGTGAAAARAAPRRRSSPTCGRAQGPVPRGPWHLRALLRARDHGIGPGDRFHLVAPDLPGFGRSPGPVSVDGSAKAVADLIERYAPVYLCGYSMGAFVAARVAAERPEGIRRLVLCRSQHKAGRDRATSHEVLPIAVRVVADEGGFLPRIQAPTLVLCGRRDRACFPDMQLIADAIPNATALVVPHTGHSLPVTHAEAFNAIVSGFLAEAGAGTPR